MSLEAEYLDLLLQDVHEGDLEEFYEFKLQDKVAI